MSLSIGLYSIAALATLLYNVYDDHSEVNPACQLVHLQKKKHYW